MYLRNPLRAWGTIMRPAGSPISPGAGSGCDAPIAWFYLVLSFLLVGVSLLLSPNANSLHRLYRDRLSKAFLFDPTADRGTIARFALEVAYCAGQHRLG